MAGARSAERSLDHAARAEDLWDRIASRGVDAAVLFERGNVRYLTGWRQNSVAHSAIVVTAEGLKYLVPSLDETAVQAECWIGSDDIHTFPEEGDAVTAVIDCLDTADRIGVEGATITAQRRTRLESVGEVADVGDVLAAVRMHKSPAERALYREATALTEDVYHTVLQQATVGVRECDLTAVARMEMEGRGAEGASFEPFAMTGEHAGMPHRTATGRRISQGDLVILDLGLTYGGYATDMTRTFLFGEPSDEQRRIFEATQAAQHAAIETVEPGVSGERVHDAAVEVLAEWDLDDRFPHLTGHGLGHDVHEPPILDAGETATLEPGMVITVEPGVYVPDVGGARIEDVLLVTEDGHELLTDLRRDLVNGLVPAGDGPSDARRGGRS